MPREKDGLVDDMQAVIVPALGVQELAIAEPVSPSTSTREGGADGTVLGSLEQEGLKLTNEVDGMNPYAADAMALRKAYGKLAKEGPAAAEGQSANRGNRERP